MKKYSRQRECILNDLRNRHDHPTADMVYASIRKELPNISLGTVYRNLALLAQHRQILKISTPEGADRFDGLTEPHSHFVCKCCGGLTDIVDHPGKEMILEISDSFPGEVEEFDLLFYGKCNACLAQNNL